MRRAVVYYTLTNNTKEAAEHIAEHLDAHLIQIDTIKPMPSSFGAQMMYGGMQATFGLKPNIQGVPADILNYDEIIVGTPVWAGKHAPAVNTFLHMPNVKGKVTGVFVVSGGGENKKCIPLLKKMLPNLKHTLELTDHKLGRDAENTNKLEAFCAEF